MQCMLTYHLMDRMNVIYFILSVILDMYFDYVLEKLFELLFNCLVVMVHPHRAV